MLDEIPCPAQSKNHRIWGHAEQDDVRINIRRLARTCTCEMPFAEGSCEPTVRHEGAAAADGPAS